jgi:carbon monoxide dehydrogenase subunit G
VKILEEVPPERCVLAGELAGPTGVVQGEASFTLSDLGQASQVHYEGSGIITGALASVNPRFIEATVNSFIKIGLACLNKQLKQKKDFTTETQSAQRIK